MASVKKKIQKILLSFFTAENQFCHPSTCTHQLRTSAVICTECQLTSIWTCHCTRSLVYQSAEPSVISVSQHLLYL